MSDTDARLLRQFELFKVRRRKSSLSYTNRSWRSYDAGHLIVDLGDQTAEVFLVVAGTVRAIIRSREGKDIVFW